MSLISFQQSENQVNLFFVKYLAVLLDAGPEIKEQIQENYDFLMEIKDRMLNEDGQTGTSSVKTNEQWLAEYPCVAAVCENAGPPRVASGESRAAGFFSDLIGNFDIDNLQKAIELILALKEFFGDGSEENDQNQGVGDGLVGD